MRSFIVAVVIFTSTAAFAGDKWDSTDYALLAASTVTLAMDWQQTRYIARNPDRFYERNRILGRYPSRQSIDLYFVSVLLTEIIVADLLPSKWRKVFLAGVAIGEGGVVAYNFQMGVRF
jgi:hypothetical protein